MTKNENRKWYTPVVDYRKLRLHNLNSNEFRHLLLLIFWPLFGLSFMFVEKYYPVEYYTPMYSVIDSFIPFFEWFLLPYLFWFVYIAGMLVYTGLYDIEAFKGMMKFIIITYTITIIIYLLWPTCQRLRPAAFERDNILTRIMRSYYQFDTNTNVCPSLHVIGGVAVMFTSFHLKNIKSTGWKISNIIITILICLSTVFLKQHSIVDAFAAVPVCLIGYYFSFCTGWKRIFKKTEIAG